MEINTAEDAAEAYKSLGDWQYADREAAWKWMFEQGRLAERKKWRSALEDTTEFMERHSNRWDGENGKHPAEVVEAARALLRSNVRAEPPP